jgi:hypothetical protein
MAENIFFKRLSLLFNLLIIALLCNLYYRDLQVESVGNETSGEVKSSLMYNNDVSSSILTSKSAPMMAQSSVNNHFLVDGSLGTVSPPSKPSIRLSEEQESKVTHMRRDYGGKGDKLHLGGFRPNDYASRSNNTWNFMMGILGVKSLIDIGCGVGVSTKYFLQKGARVLCVEGSHDAVERTLLPKDVVVEHDFTRGPYWPEETFDAAWSVEFVEHVGRQFQHNYFATFRRAAIIFMTASAFGGWHHSEIRQDWWWIAKMEAAGFVYSEELTHVIRTTAKLERGTRDDEGKYQIVGQYISQSMMVFINPALSQRPEFEHLISGHGCKWDTQQVPCDKRFKWFNRDVDTPTKDHQPLLDCTNVGKSGNANRRGKDWIGGPWECTKNPLA